MQVPLSQSLKKHQRKLSWVAEGGLFFLSSLLDQIRWVCLFTLTAHMYFHTCIKHEISEHEQKYRSVCLRSTSKFKLCWGNDAQPIFKALSVQAVLKPFYICNLLFHVYMLKCYEKQKFNNCISGKTVLSLMPLKEFWLWFCWYLLNSRGFIDQMTRTASSCSPAAHDLSGP